MPEDLPHDFLKRAYEECGLVDYRPPIALSGSVQIYPFGPYDAAGGGNWQFRTRLRFETSDASARPLMAVTMGSIIFVPGADNQSGSVVLVRGDVMGFSLTRSIGMLPSWFPQPRYFVYENVARADARQAAVAVLGNKAALENVMSSIRKHDPSFSFAGNASIPDQIADLWLANGVPGGLFVAPGDRVGACAPGVGGAFHADFGMVDTIDPAPALFYNPSYLFALWEEMGWLKGSPFPPELIDTSGPPCGTGILKTVSGGGSHSIKDQLASAAPGDTILVVDELTYEDEVIIDKPVNLMGAGSDPASAPLPNYPALNGQKGGPGAHRPVTFTSVNTGIAFVGKFIIEDGWATGARQDGGGILVEKSNHVVISSCVVRRCEASGGGIFGEGFGGGIAVYHSSPAILNCVVKFNLANSRGKGIGVFGYGWPTIVDTTVQANGPFLSGSNPRHDGGGIGIQTCVTDLESMVALAGQLLLDPVLARTFSQPRLLLAQNSHVRICRSTLEANVANDDGGGIYITCASRVILRSTQILFNQAYSNGGGIRATFGSSLMMSDCLLQGNESQADGIVLNSDGSEKRAGGGGLAARNARLVNLTRTRLVSNVANGWAGGGMSFVSTDEGTLAGLWLQILTAVTLQIAFDWNDFLLDPLIYNHDHCLLRIDAASSIETNHATFLSGLQSEDHGKGGGLYLLRWLGDRASGLGPPPDRSRAGKMEAWPSNTYVFRAGVLETSNTASYSESKDGVQKNTNRLYVENMVVDEKVFDEDIEGEVLLYPL